MDNFQAYGLLMIRGASHTVGVTMSLYQQGHRRVISARDLHQQLGIKKDFSDWIKQKIGAHRFRHQFDYEMLTADKTLLPQKGERVDQTIFPQKGENKKAETRGRKSTEYVLTLEAAKIVAMGTNNEAGDKVKRYFLECEKVALAAWPPPQDAKRLPGVEEHIRPDFQRKQSKALQAFLRQYGGANAVIQHGKTLCEMQTGLTARKIVQLGKDTGLAPAQRTSAREVLRHLAPAVACAMSLVDTIVLFGADPVEANLLAGEHHDLFAGLIDLGLAPAETWQGPRYL